MKYTSLIVDKKPPRFPHSVHFIIKELPGNAEPIKNRRQGFVALLVRIIRSRAEFCFPVHGCRADLDFQGKTVYIFKGSVDRLIPILFGGAYIVVQFFVIEFPDWMFEKIMKF